MKSLMNLLKKIWTQLIGAANDTYDKNYDPVRAMKQAIRQIDEECTNLEERYVRITQRSKSAKRLVKEKQSLAEDTRQRAKHHKETGETTKAQMYAERLVKIQEWLEKYDSSQAEIVKHKVVIKDVHDELEFKKEELELELDLMEASKEMADFKIDRITNIEGFNNVNGIESIIKEAREKVAQTEDLADSYEEAQETFKGEETSTQRNISERAQTILNEL